MRASATFHFEDVSAFSIPNGFLSWLKGKAKTHKQSFRLTYVFCSDEHLLQINKAHLSHDYFTDIITFDKSTTPHRIQADIFISQERVEDNAKSERCSFAAELTRVMAHGVFHLLGFGDKTEDEALIMRRLETEAIHEILNVSRETK